MKGQLSQSGFGTMGKDAREKLRNDNDIKILIVGKNSQTGIGKTTFAIQLCRWIDQTNHGWNAEEKAFIDVGNYIEAHLEKAKGSCLMLDEIEAGADNRRAMSHDNVELSHAWMTMRARNIATVATLPSTDTLDKRMLSLADYWVLVRKRGVAQPYKVKVNDFNGKVQRKPLNPNKDGLGEMVTFPDLPDDDEDKQHLDSIKDDMLRGLTKSARKIPVDEHEEQLEKAKKEARREERDKMIEEVYENTELTTTDLGEMDWTGVTQPQVSRILNSN
jgi:hypothetical protein